MLATLAPAKVNLTLHILGRLENGYHALHSLVAFASIGDRLTLTPSPGPFTLTMRGPTAAMAGETGDNLVLKAANALAARLPGLKGGHFSLLKRLPVAAGLGGGSSDAAAALRLLALHHGLPLEHDALLDAARATGSDVPVCLAGSLRVMTGTGHDLRPALDWPRLAGLLVNPGVAVATAPVFAALGLKPGMNHKAPAPQDMPQNATRPEALNLIASGRNDMEEAAIGLAPAIASALKSLEAQPGCQLARMSGSGATVFGLFPSCRAAGAAAKVIRAREPGWWVKPVWLG